MLAIEAQSTRCVRRRSGPAGRSAPDSRSASGHTRHRAPRVPASRRWLPAPVNHATSVARWNGVSSRRANCARPRPRRVKPSVAVAGGVDYARPNPRIFPRADRWDDSWDIGVNVRWSLWDGGRTAADVAQAAGAIEVARQRLAEFDSVLAVEVRQRALDIESGRAAVAAASDAVRAATEARRVVAERYQAGVIAQIEVLDAEYALLQAELDRARALAGVRLSEARLARAIGR